MIGITELEQVVGNLSLILASKGILVSLSILPRVVTDDEIALSAESVQLLILPAVPS